MSTLEGKLVTRFFKGFTINKFFIHYLYIIVKIFDQKFYIFQSRLFTSFQSSTIHLTKLSPRYHATPLYTCAETWL